MDRTTAHLPVPPPREQGLDPGLAAAVAASGERLGRRAHAAWAFHAPNPSVTRPWEELTGGQQDAFTAAAAAAVMAAITEIAPFWVAVTGDGDLSLSCPGAETLGCLFGRELDGAKTTLGQLLAAAMSHAGPEADYAHRDLAAYLALCEAAGMSRGGYRPPCGPGGPGCG